MRIFCGALFFLLLSLNVTAQDTLRMYDANGRLIADTSFSISKKQLKRFKPFEKEFVVKLCDHLYYPEVEKEAQIQGTVIMSFCISDSGKIDSIHAEKLMPYGKYLGKTIGKSLEKITVLRSFNTKGIENKKYYVAINYSISDKAVDGKEGIETKEINNGVIKIIYVPRHVKYEGHVQTSVDYYEEIGGNR
jgi:hypothetical protein